jgi:fluoride ion exporter CrcB/FEX
MSEEGAVGQQSHQTTAGFHHHASENDAQRVADGDYVALSNRTNDIDCNTMTNISSITLSPPPPPPLLTLNYLSLSNVITTTTATTVCCVSLAAIAGALLRMALAQVFGEACHNPGTVGWLSAGAPVCLTSSTQSQTSSSVGHGMIFSDLPSNMVGSFLMGLVQDGTVLGLATNQALSWLPPGHPLERATVWHVAFKTGFCGSLTTLSSWNSAMVVVLFGTNVSAESLSVATQLWTALFGYIIGMETALGSFVFGCAVARALHQHVCPALAEEADASRRRREQGWYLNRHLPDTERRFLHEIEESQNDQSSSYFAASSAKRMDSLLQWRTSTREARRVGSSYLSTLVEIETALLIQYHPKTTLSHSAESVAQAQGWALESLWDYVRDKELDEVQELHSLPGVPAARASQAPFWVQLPFVATLLGLVLGLLLTGLIVVRADTAMSNTYRTMIFAMLIAPSGALVRWILSSWNGTCPLLPVAWRWLPAGTFIANVIGSIVSIVSVAVEYRLHNGDYDVTAFWATGSLRAVKIGFAGCLTTVSTFVAEINGYLRDNKSNQAYSYMLITLGTCCAVASLLYGCIVYIV